MAEWGHWCHDQVPTSLPVTEPQCVRCGAMNLTPSRLLLEANPDPNVAVIRDMLRRALEDPSRADHGSPRG